MKTICCECRRTKDKNGWSRKTAPGTKASHGLCPDCYRRTLTRISRHGRTPEAA